MSTRSRRFPWWGTRRPPVRPSPYVSYTVSFPGWLCDCTSCTAVRKGEAALGPADASGSYSNLLSSKPSISSTAAFLTDLQERLRRAILEEAADRLFAKDSDT